MDNIEYLHEIQDTIRSCLKDEIKNGDITKHKEVHEVMGGIMPVEVYKIPVKVSLAEPTALVVGDDDNTVDIGCTMSILGEFEDWDEFLESEELAQAIEHMAIIWMSIITEEFDDDEYDMLFAS